MKGKLLFRCRLCGEVHEVDDDDVKNTLYEWDTRVTHMYRLHKCTDTTTGVSDLIGGQEFEEDYVEPVEEEAQLAVEELKPVDVKEIANATLVDSPAEQDDSVESGTMEDVTK